MENCLADTRRAGRSESADKETPEPPLPVTMEMTLVARLYERAPLRYLHAVTIAAPAVLRIQMIRSA